MTGTTNTPSPHDGLPSAVAGLEPPRLEFAALPAAVRRELRVDQVGELVAVRLYDGALAGSRDPDVRRFAAGHQRIERAHLALFEAYLPPRARSRLGGFWRLAGWLLGWVPARLGPAALYAVVAGVERWVDGHYARQIALVRRLAPDPDLLRMLEACRSDEARHAADAEDLYPKAPWWARALAAVAVGCSRAGVLVARWV
ncbi:MAG TPA: demethoxyubiquinone hydroxylase family protein [Azospirillum sp.]|nr:demethoxyubiquinone hydroxylase family protein [Azospirillum sp.]